jgi:hypothetical protein
MKGKVIEVLLVAALMHASSLFFKTIEFRIALTAR